MSVFEDLHTITDLVYLVVRMQDTGRDPITGEELSKDDLIPIKDNKVSLCTALSLSLCSSAFLFCGMC